MARHFICMFVKYFVYVGAPIYAFSAYVKIDESLKGAGSSSSLMLLSLSIMFVVGSVLLLRGFVGMLESEEI